MTGTQSQALVSIATVINDKTGWWTAFGVSVFLFISFRNEECFSLQNENQTFKPIIDSRGLLNVNGFA